MRSHDGWQCGPVRSGTYLTPRQLELLYLRKFGHNNRVIAAKLGISERTVEVYFGGIADRIGLSKGRLLLWLTRGGEMKVDEAEAEARFARQCERKSA